MKNENKYCRDTVQRPTNKSLRAFVDSIWVPELTLWTNTNFSLSLLTHSPNSVELTLIATSVIWYSCMRSCTSRATFLYVYAWTTIYLFPVCSGQTIKIQFSFSLGNHRKNSNVFRIEFENIFYSLLCLFASDFVHAHAHIIYGEESTFHRGTHEWRACVRVHSAHIDVISSLLMEFPNESSENNMARKAQRAFRVSVGAVCVSKR